MTVLRPETAVVSNLLCDLSDAPAAQREQVGAALVRALGLTNPDPDFAATAAAGYIEPPDVWAARINHTNTHGGNHA